MTLGRSVSPKESLQSLVPVSHSFPIPHFTVQGTSGVGITGRLIDAPPFAITPAIPSISYTENSDVVPQRDIYSPTGRTGTTFDAARPTL